MTANLDVLKTEDIRMTISASLYSSRSEQWPTPEFDFKRPRHERIRSTETSHVISGQ